MHAASREAYTAGVERLEAIEGDPAKLVEVAQEILAVARLLGREPRLRRALADPARPGEDRVALLRDMLGNKLGGEALDVLGVVVGGRWSRPSEMLDATERLAVDALLISAERAGTLADIEDELFRFGKIVDGDLRLASLLTDSTADLNQRASLIGNLLDGRADPITVQLAQAALAGFGGRSFAGSLGRIVELAAERRNRSVAYITVAAPLTESDEQRLGARLAELYGREVSLKITVDPEILGGMSVQVGHDLYDGTVARRLNETRHALAGR